MDLPPVHHHHPRYVPLHPPVAPLPRQPRPLSFFSDDRPLYNIYPAHLPPPPLPQPPPPPPAFRPLHLPPPTPLPPPPHPLQSQFTFLSPTPSVDYDQRSQDHLRRLDLVPSRPLFDERRLGVSELDTYQLDFWLPSGVPPGRRLGVLDFDSEYPQPTFNHNPILRYRTIDEFRHESDGSFRFGKDYSDRFDQNQRVEFGWGRSDDCRDDDYCGRRQFVSNSNNAFKSFGLEKFNSDSLLRDYVGSSGDYESQFGSRSDNQLFRNGRGDRGGEESENQRWRQTQFPPPEFSSSFQMGSKENNDGIWVEERIPHVLELGKYSSRAARDGGGGFVCTPRKKSHKKSVLLRLQKPTSRNRHDDRSVACFDDSDLVDSDHGMEGEREGSPVELDVSFRSNVLVAKAITTPSSSDQNLITRNRKIRKIKLPSKDSSSLQLIKDSFSEYSVKSDGLSLIANDPSSSNKDPKVSGDQVKFSGIEAVYETGSYHSSSIVDVSLVKSVVGGSDNSAISETGVIGVASNETSSLTGRKKKKFPTSLSSSLSLQLENRHNESVGADGSACSQSAASRYGKCVTRAKENTIAGTVSNCETVVEPHTNEAPSLLGDNKVNVSPKIIVSEKGSTAIDSTKTFVHPIKRRRACSTSFSGSSSSEKTKTDEGLVNADISVYDLCTISNSDKDLTNFSQDNSASGHGFVDGIDKQGFRNDATMQPVTNNISAVSEALLSVENNASEEHAIHKAPVNMPSSSCALIANLISDNSSIKIPEKFCVSNSVTVDDTFSNHSCSNQVSASLENGVVRESSKTAYSYGGNTSIGLSNSEEAVFGVLLNADSSNHCSGSVLGSANGLTNSQQKVNMSNVGVVDEVGKLKCPDGVTLLLGKVDMAVPMEAEVLLGNDVGSSKEVTPNSRRKRKVRRQSDLSSSEKRNTLLGFGNLVSPLLVQDSNSCCSIKDFSQTKEEITAAVFGGLDDGSRPPFKDETCTLYGNSSTEGLEKVKVSAGSGVNISLNGTSPRYKKKRTAFSSLPGLSSQTMCEINEEPKVAVTCRFGATEPLKLNEGIACPEEEVVVPGLSMLCSSSLLPCRAGTSVLPENYLMQESLDSYSAQNSASLNACPSRLEGEQTENATPVMVINKLENATKDIESEKEHHMLFLEIDRYKTSEDLQSPDLNKRPPSIDMDCGNHLPVKDVFSSVSNCLPLCGEGDGASTSHHDGEVMKSVSESLSNMTSPDSLSFIPSLQMLDTKPPLDQISFEDVRCDEKKLDRKPLVDDSILFAHSSLPQSTKINSNSDQATGSDHLITGETASYGLQDAKITVQDLNPHRGEPSEQKNQMSHAVPRVFAGHPPFSFSSSKRAFSSSIMAKSHTWHRISDSFTSPPGKNSFSNTVSTQKPVPKKIAKTQNTSYIRKGNSLVRKPASGTALNSSVYRLNFSGGDDLKKSTRSEQKVDPLNSLKLGGINPSSEKPSTPPLHHSTRLSNCTSIPSGVCSSSSLANLLLNDSSGKMSDLSKFAEMKDAAKFSKEALNSISAPENQNSSTSNLESHVANDGNLVSAKMKKIIYIKRKSNQLVAASNPRDFSIQSADKTQTLSSDGYYKKRKNQLIRTSWDSHIRKTVSVTGDSSNSEGQKAPKIMSSRGSNKRRSEKVLMKKSKPSKFSLVWTLGGTQSLKKNRHSLQCENVLPHLFPWKRATYWRNFRQNSAPNNKSLSMISRKLLLSRKRDTIYTRSTLGFSLRKSKVLSVDGSSLKWSKSIEKRSKKANEEATLAVAEAERQKREKNGAFSTISGTSRNHSSSKSVLSIDLRPGERIFRIGSFRYKMDSSRRTLQRISDEESSCFVAIQSDNDVKKTYVPRRLLIGNDEYVRIGNGNQLIRDPKKRTRLLASEKVRWSLHTARLRLARKRKYCQFYTRFGKCNKDNGKCPYMHDPSKIAVCTKFLNGLCSNPMCKLTHKIIPERMQDCSYFLQGLCSNESCPYRHVNVNPNASICEGFLKGYCADGDECKKKHSYVCPSFEATGVCPQRSKCKLHHPKKRSKVEKRKQLIERKNTRGRYFGSFHVDIAESVISMPEKHNTQDNDDIFFQGGRFADFISLEASDEEAGEMNDRTSELPTLQEHEPSDLQLDDLDELIKPIRLMD